MRVISQDRCIDVNYDNVILYVGYPNEDGYPVYIDGHEDLVMATYSSEEAAKYELHQVCIYYAADLKRYIFPSREESIGERTFAKED